jgi:hypothetical protein
MNLDLKKRITSGLLMYGIMASGYGFMMKASGPATNTLKFIFGMTGSASLMAGSIMQIQLNKSNHPSGK